MPTIHAYVHRSGYVYPHTQLSCAQFNCTQNNAHVSRLDINVAAAIDNNWLAATGSTGVFINRGRTW